MSGLVLVRQLKACEHKIDTFQQGFRGILASVALLASYSLEAAEPLSVEAARPLDRMTADERSATGVERLSADELAALNNWLSQQLGASFTAPLGTDPAAATDPAATTATKGFEAVIEVATPTGTLVANDAVPAQNAAIEAEVARRVAQELAAARADDQAVELSEPFEARVIGGFTGWSGKTVFTLDNGQVWRQRHGTSYRYQGDDNRVRLEPNFFGFWDLTVVSTGRSVGVRRID